MSAATICLLEASSLKLLLNWDASASSPERSVRSSTSSMFTCVPSMGSPMHCAAQTHWLKTRAKIPCIAQHKLIG
eukprot:1157543-Pelagomonas_calceolata.AAC.8